MLPPLVEEVTNHTTSHECHVMSEDGFPFRDLVVAITGLVPSDNECRNQCKEETIPEESVVHAYSLTILHFHQVQPSAQKYGSQGPTGLYPVGQIEVTDEAGMVLQVSGVL